VVVFVLAGGMRAVAWVSVLKDVLMIVVALVIGIYVPAHYFGGVTPMFDRLVQAHAAHLVLPGSTKTMNRGWFISTVLLSALGFYMWPHTFSAAFTARNSETLRRNAVMTPLYTLSLLFIFFAGFAALLLLPGLSNGDMSLLLLARNTFPPWFLGIIGGAGALTAMVPSAIILLAASTLAAKNVVRPLFAPHMSDQPCAAVPGTGAIAEPALPLFRAALFHHPGVAVAAGIRGRDPVLPRSRARPVLAGRHRHWSVCRIGRGHRTGSGTPYYQT
jgi:SSS family solute:Na+ symporter